MSYHYQKYYEQQRAYRESHREERNQKARERYAENKEKMKEQAKAYQEAHKDEIKQKKKEYREAHKEEIKVKSKEYYEANKEKIAEYNKRYREERKVVKERPEHKAVWKEGDLFPHNNSKLNLTPNDFVLCSHCDEVYTGFVLSKHRKTKKHIDRLGDSSNSKMFSSNVLIH
jgi:hypothetical protein